MGNVILHTTSEAEARVLIDGSLVTVEVRDTSPALPVRKRYGDRPQPGGVSCCWRRPPSHGVRNTPEEANGCGSPSTQGGPIRSTSGRHPSRRADRAASNALALVRSALDDGTTQPAVGCMTQFRADTGPPVPPRATRPVDGSDPALCQRGRSALAARTRQEMDQDRVAHLVGGINASKGSRSSESGLFRRHAYDSGSCEPETATRRNDLLSRRGWGRR